MDLYRQLYSSVALVYPHSPNANTNIHVSKSTFNFVSSFLWIWTSECLSGHFTSISSYVLNGCSSGVRPFLPPSSLIYLQLKLFCLPELWIDSMGWLHWDAILGPQSQTFPNMYSCPHHQQPICSSSHAPYLQEGLCYPASLGATLDSSLSFVSWSMFSHQVVLILCH